MALVPESQDQDYNYADYGLEATQLSQPLRDTQTNTQPVNSQVEPRRKYCEYQPAALSPAKSPPLPR